MFFLVGGLFLIGFFTPPLLQLGLATWCLAHLDSPVTPGRRPAALRVLLAAWVVHSVVLVAGPVVLMVSNVTHHVVPVEVLLAGVFVGPFLWFARPSITTRLLAVADIPFRRWIAAGETLLGVFYGACWVIWMRT